MAWFITFHKSCQCGNGFVVSQKMRNYINTSSANSCAMRAKMHDARVCINANINNKDTAEAPKQYMCTGARTLRGCLQAGA